MTLRRETGRKFNHAVDKLTASHNITETPGDLHVEKLEKHESRGPNQHAVSVTDGDNEFANEIAQRAISLPQPISDPMSTLHSDIDKEKLIQIFFDALYLDKVLSIIQPLGQTEDALSALLQSLEVKGLVNSAGTERLKKGATEYLRKTYLLFVLLV